jgi:hypothetical protein
MIGGAAGGQQDCAISVTGTIWFAYSHAGAEFERDVNNKELLFDGQATPTRDLEHGLLSNPCSVHIVGHVESVSAEERFPGVQRSATKARDSESIPASSYSFAVSL